jgi:O-antigen ligase
MRLDAKQRAFQSAGFQGRVSLPRAYPLLVMSAYALSVFFQGGGYLAYLVLAVFLWIDGKGKTRLDEVSKSILIMLPAFFFLAPLSKYFSIGLHLEESLKLTTWLALAFIFSKISVASLSSLFSFVRIFTLLGFALLPFQLDRFQGFYSHPNHLAYVCSLLIAWTVLLDRYSGRRKWAYVLLLFAAVLASKSSGGLINALLAMGAGLVFGKKIKLSNALVALGALVLGGASAFALGLGDDLLEKIAGAFDADLVERADAQAFGADGSFVWRVTYWIAIYSDFCSEGDWAQLFGIGPGLMSAGSYFYDYMIVDPHNDFLRVLVERGWLGLSLMLYVFTRFARGGGLSRIFSLLVLLQMSVGNVVVHLPTMVVFIGLLSLAFRLRKIEVLGGRAIE